MRTFCVAAALAAILTSPGAHAAIFNFNLTFDGTSIALDPGSDDPVGTVLEPGDDFTLMLFAAGADFWRVTEVLDNAAFPSSFLVDELGTRFADIETVWSLDGSETASQSESGVEQSQVHVGAQSWSLPVGVEFDKVTISWILVS